MQFFWFVTKEKPQAVAALLKPSLKYSTIIFLISRGQDTESLYLLKSNFENI